MNPRDATNEIKFGAIYMATAALIDGFMTKCLPARIPRTATIIFSRGLAAPTDRRDGHHDVLLREIPMLYPGIRRRRRYALGRRHHVVSKLLFKPFMELRNNRSYFGSEIWDTNAPGYQQVQQALRHIVSQQLSPDVGVGRAIDGV